MLHTDAKAVVDTINARIYRIEESFQRARGCRDSWNEKTEYEFQKSIKTLVEARSLFYKEFPGLKYDSYVESYERLIINA